MKKFVSCSDLYCEAEPTESMDFNKPVFMWPKYLDIFFWVMHSAFVHKEYYT